MTQAISEAANQNYFSQITAGTKSTEESQKDQFLKLLTYQLRAQNPLKPYDNQEFAAQLAQFSQLEQLSDIKSLLEEQVQTNLLLSQTMANSALPGMIGKNAKALSNKIVVKDGEDDLSLGFTLNKSVQSGKITIYNESGSAVTSFDLKGEQLSRGDQAFQWDGKDSKGKELPAGNYTFKVEVTDANGAGFTTDVFTSGKITAVRFKNEGTFLVINGNEVPLHQITDISA